MVVMVVVVVCRSDRARDGAGRRKSGHLRKLASSCANCRVRCELLAVERFKNMHNSSVNTRPGAAERCTSYLHRPLC